MGSDLAGRAALVTKAAALDYAAQGMRINAIAPGPVDTDPARRWW